MDAHWPAAPKENLNLAAHEVHVWRASLVQSEAVYEKLQSLVADDELARAGQFKFEKLRKRFVVARGVLRDILRRYTGIATREIAFEYEAHGKPKLAAAMSRSDICFNLSHAENFALCAVALDRAVGVDVEFLRPLDDAERIAKRFFSAAESAQFCALPEEKKLHAFYNCWTRKEAFIKAIGEGLSHPLHRFEVAFVPGEPAALLCTRPDPSEAAKWTLQALAPAPDYAGAVVAAGKDFNLACWQWQAD